MTGSAPVAMALVGLLLSAAPPPRPEPPASRPAAPTTRPSNRPDERPGPGAPNPPAPGFDAEGSDARAVALADDVMERMGGRAAWDGTRYLAWNFFGARQHVWDKHTGNIRVEGVGRADGLPYVILMNVRTGQGRAWRDGEAVRSESERARLMEFGRSVWINDSYWLVMPYKLKDSGVTLTHRGEAAMLDGRPADVLELTFTEVGDTPENRYLAYVARDTGLVEQWDFFPRRDATDPGFQLPWSAWSRHGRIMLSGERGERDLTDIAVFDELPDTAFTSPEPVQLN